MYDVVFDLFSQEDGFADFSPPSRPTFYEHIYPIFKRMAQTQWVNGGFHFLFGPGSQYDLLQEEFVHRLAEPGDAEKELRHEIFTWFRDPDQSLIQPTDLPPFYGDGYGDVDEVGITGLSVTRTQYSWLRKWHEGDFDAGVLSGSLNSLEDYPPDQQPDILNRAHLEDCLGGPFHPGIELTWTLRVGSMWKRPFRLHILPEDGCPRDDYGPVLTPEVAMAPGGVVDASGPGTLTRWLGVPWQTDEASCMSGYRLASYIPTPSYWAARVPNQVLSARSYERLKDGNSPVRQRLKHFEYRQKWLRYFHPDYFKRIATMVKKWDQAGIVSPKPAPDDDPSLGLPPLIWVESEVAEGLIQPQTDSSFIQLLIAEKALEPDPDQTPAEAGLKVFTSAAKGQKDGVEVLRRDEL
jgi:hypothetical protein